MLTQQMVRYFLDKEDICRKNDKIEPALYNEYGVNKGLRAGHNGSFHRAASLKDMFSESRARDIPHPEYQRG